MQERKGVVELVEDFLTQVKDVQAKVQGCSSEEDCLAIEEALVGIGQTVAALMGSLPAAYDLFLERFMLIDRFEAAEILGTLADLSKEVQSFVESRQAPATEGEGS